MVNDLINYIFLRYHLLTLRCYKISQTYVLKLFNGTLYDFALVFDVDHINVSNDITFIERQ